MGSNMFKYRIAIFSEGSRYVIYGAQYEQDAIILAENMLNSNKNTDKAIIEIWDESGMNCLETLLTLEATYERVVTAVE